MRRPLARWALFPVIAVIGSGGLPCHSLPPGDSATPGVAWALPVAQGVVQDVRVDLSEWGLTPSHVTLAVDRPVRFTVTNHGAIPHALAVEGDGLYAETDGIGTSGTVRLQVTFSSPGVYDLFCPIGTGQHRALGQEGSLTVVRAVPGMQLPLIGPPPSQEPALDTPSAGWAPVGIAEDVGVTMAEAEPVGHAENVDATMAAAETYASSAPPVTPPEPPS